MTPSHNSIVSACSLVSSISLQQEEQGFSGEWPILGMGQEIHKMSQEHPLEPESKKALKTQTNQPKIHMKGPCQSERSQLREWPVAQNGAIRKTK